ncbi:LOW QUALITY PROTEIN: hypothetical protein TorRG33x02_018820 [Trema orientale]|uniref:Uncharacterized protein n=1 Tax=Trema orientale TaxID=63057 RepID=A0A2P5FWD8_TREOI|nr:LOW QUALITY PROTEIN: hypothetical protein TorRG33x02_018820 [Trema orientale]
MTTMKFEIDKFTKTNDFNLWQGALLVYQGLDDALSKETIDAKTDRVTAKKMESKAHNAILLSLGDEMLKEVKGESTKAGLLSKLIALYIKKLVANRLYRRKKKGSILCI